MYRLLLVQRVHDGIRKRLVVCMAEGESHEQSWSYIPLPMTACHDQLWLRSTCAWHALLSLPDRRHGCRLGWEWECLLRAAGAPQWGKGN